ncbi:hypothetical protein IWZ03DRAFT_241887 [Phyllosticta citriasiana]|uniref:Zn(2)-C6 fungal-type domain-containing protein n=1 Tax=Phyllosticta citriasiana TaxID=595635 RepID=A0ABR1KFI8_9PEZI
MVGVPGRSKGCHTCRRRHVKCDERKPTCFQCERAGYVCQGYKKTIRFMFQNPGASRSSRPNRKSSSESSTDLKIIPAGTFRQKPKLQPNAANSTGQKHASLAKQQKSYKMNLPSSVPQELNLSAFQNNIAFSFTFSNLVYSSFGRPWLQMAAQGRVDEVSEAASKALALGFLGNSQRQKQLQDRSFKEYGHSLQILIRDLSNLDQERALRCIIPVMIILMYTFSVHQSSDFGHHEGLKKLVLLCGPEKFQKQPFLGAFEAARDILISKAMLEHKRTFLEEEQWQTVPWKLNPEARSPSSRLLDVLSYVPGLLENEDSLKERSDSDAITLRASLLAQTQQHLQDLFKWRWEWERQNPDAAHAVPASVEPGGPTEIPQGLETVLRYKRFIQANEICLYNAVLLWLLRFLGDLCPSEPITSPRYYSPSAASDSSSDEYAELTRKILHETTPTPLLLPGQARTLKQPALEICRSFEFLLENFAHTQDTALAWLMPLSLAYYVLKDDKPYVEWVRTKLDGFQGKPPFRDVTLPVWSIGNGTSILATVRAWWWTGMRT